MSTYWTQSLAPIVPKCTPPSRGGFLIVGSGITGVSAAYHLLRQGVQNISIVDCGTPNASYFRNAGHILHGASESYQAMIDIHGRAKAKAIFTLSQSFCNEIKDTIHNLNIECDYLQGNYLTIASSSVEEQKLKESLASLQEDGFNYCSTANIDNLPFKTKSFAKQCSLSAQANPAKFRDELLRYVISQGVSYHVAPVVRVEGDLYSSSVKYRDGSKSTHDATIIATNAYSSLISEFISTRGLVVPFKGQILVSKPLQQYCPRFHFSTEYGYIYGTITKDNRLLIGGWRNNVPGHEIGTYATDCNPEVEKGLDNVAQDLFTFNSLEWEYSWAGIMGSSKTGLPFVGPTNSPTVFICVGCSGYGFGWFHGSARLLVDIIMGNPLLKGYEYLNPMA